MRYKPGSDKNEKVIQVHCKNHKCKNLKEQGGWFTLKYYYISNRIWSIETNQVSNYFYCSDKCKQECSLYKKLLLN